MTIVAASDTPLRRTIDVVAEHVAAELTSDPDVIAGTIGADAFFPVLVRGPDGLDFRVLTDADEIREYYRVRLEAFEIVDTCRVHEQRTEWYAFHESVARVRHVGPFNGVPGTGRTVRVHSVILFPADADGILGELEWTRYDFADLFRGTVAAPTPATGPEAHLPLRRVDIAARHDRFVNALVAGDVAGMLAEMSDAPRWAGRHGDPVSPLPGVVRAEGVDAVGPHLRTLATATDVVVLNRHVDDWYVVAELGLRWPDAPFRSRMVSLFPVQEDGRFLAHLGHAVVAPG